MQGIPLLYGSTGETLTEKSGNLNLGIPGIMYVGAISGVIGAFCYESSVGPEAFNGFLAVVIALLATLLGSLLMGLLYCFLTVTLRANQNVTGLAMTTFGVGFGNFFGGSLIKLSGNSMPYLALTNTSLAFQTKLPGADTTGWFGQLFLSYGFLAYLAVIISLVAAYVLKRTRIGLHLRSVGENPATADAAGINVTKYKYVATCIGSGIAGLGGFYYIIDYMASQEAYLSVEAFGWLSIALVIFALWRPHLTLIGSVAFGFLFSCSSFITNIPGIFVTMAMKPILRMLPYVVTILVLIVSSIRNKKENQPPASLGLSYFREER